MTNKNYRNIETGSSGHCNLLSTAEAAPEILWRGVSQGIHTRDQCRGWFMPSRATILETLWQGNDQCIRFLQLHFPCWSTETL